MDSNRLSRRHLLRLAAVAAATSMGATACGTADTNNSGALSDDPVTLRLNWWGGDARHAATKEAIAAFHKKHPTITVKPEFADWTGYWDKLATTVAAGDAPDVVQMDQLYLASYAQRGALVDLGGEKKYLSTKHTDTGVLDTGKLDGRMYAMPIGAVSEGVLVNEDLLSKYGVDLPDTAAWDWEDLAAFSRKITTKSGGAVFGFGPNGGDSMLLTLWARQHGQALFKDHKLAIPQDTLADFWTYLKDLVDSKAAPSASKISESLAAALDQNLFSTKKVALGIVPSSMITAYSAASGSNLSLAPLPKAAGATDAYQYGKASMYWSITSKSKHPAEAALLIDFLVNSETAGKILGFERGIPANLQIRSSIAGSLTATDKAAATYLNTVAKTQGSAPEIVPNGASDIEAVLTRYYQKVLFGQSAPAAAAKACIAELSSSIASA